MSRTRFDLADWQGDGVTTRAGIEVPLELLQEVSLAPVGADVGPAQRIGLHAAGLSTAGPRLAKLARAFVAPPIELTEKAAS
jgi:hypothetical protein